MSILLIATSLALMVVYAGIKLLIQTKKEMLGIVYNCAAWFFVAAGLFTLACTGACCIAMCCKYNMNMMYTEGGMMEGYHHGDINEYMGWPDHEKMLKHHFKEGEACNIRINCCRKDMEKCCSSMDACKPDTTKYRK